ncbi:MAG: cytochrome c maturation protein CcmE [Gammaproteobacteria bacterium]|nr:cytochrome c maturation protein CcmE [Gammaproteobacteria bacterium]MDJ0873593.1 cytochrome c maturation protein CcmE [Gammaproteobacteria bacterium]MDJ0892213.1 cytochrome c maturation protein CcmE [Gammaproteobacteria bacterium]
MTPTRKKRLILASLIVGGVTLSVAFMLMALQENLNHFYSPTQVVAGEPPDGRPFRLGGLVEDGSISREDDGLTVHFVVTDTAEKVPVIFTGILPDLFREGQGVIAQGKLEQGTVFRADEVLAKHDENYMPPEVADAISTAQGTGVPMTHPGAGI